MQGVKTSGTANFKSVPCFKNQPRFVGVIKQNEIQQTKNFPVITVCPVPGFDLEKVSKYGYKSIYQFQRGEIEGKTKGWSGNSSSPVGDVVQDIVIYKSPKDCPVVKARFEGKPDFEQLKSNLTNLFEICWS